MSGKRNVSVCIGHELANALYCCRLRGCNSAIIIKGQYEGGKTILCEGPEQVSSNTKTTLDLLPPFIIKDMLIKELLLRTCVLSKRRAHISIS